MTLQIRLLYTFAWLCFQRQAPNSCFTSLCRRLLLSLGPCSADARHPTVLVLRISIESRAQASRRRPIVTTSTTDNCKDKEIAKFECSDAASSEIIEEPVELTSYSALELPAPNCDCADWLGEGKGNKNVEALRPPSSPTTIPSVRSFTIGSLNIELKGRDRRSKRNATRLFVFFFPPLSFTSTKYPRCSQSIHSEHLRSSVTANATSSNNAAERSG